jgi:pimeloyl-ACP methyl ester carboxylesterase
VLLQMPLSAPVDDFRLAYDVAGDGPAAVLLHGWPGDRSDWREVVSLLGDRTVLAPDLRGFGGSDKHPADPAAAYGPEAQARSVAGLIDELGLERPVVAGYDVGSRIAQALGRERPDLVRALVLAPPLPGIGERILGEGPMREFWYQSFHRLPLADELLDGKPDAIRAYLRHIWSRWSGPDFELAEADLDRLVALYSPPGAFTASIAWYRAGGGSVARSLAERAPAPEDRLAVPATVLWPEHDPLFPREWSDRLGEFLADFELRPLDGVGHFSPLEAPGDWAGALQDLDV